MEGHCCSASIQQVYSTGTQRAKLGRKQQIQRSPLRPASTICRNNLDILTILGIRLSELSIPLSISSIRSSASSYKVTFGFRTTSSMMGSDLKIPCAALEVSARRRVLSAAENNEARVSRKRLISTGGWETRLASDDLVIDESICAIERCLSKSTRARYVGKSLTWLAILEPESEERVWAFLISKVNALLLSTTPNGRCDANNMFDTSHRRKQWPVHL